MWKKLKLRLGKIVQGVLNIFRKKKPKKETITMETKGFTDENGITFGPGAITLTPTEKYGAQPITIYWEEKMKTAQGRDALIIKKTLIDLRKDQYIIKSAYRKPIVFTQAVHSSKNFIPLDGEITIGPDGLPISSGITLLDPKVCSAILCNYSRLKQDSWGNFESDTWYLIYDFENICDKALERYPLYMRIVEYKIDGMQNIDIQEAIQQEFGIKHSVEYISSLWRKKIPALIASAAEDEFLDWYFMKEEKGTYKKCSRCKQVKLANNKYFSYNGTSKDGWYSICKKCRNEARAKKVNPN